MAPYVFHNITFATAAAFDDLLRFGVELKGRGGRARELRNRITVLTHPLERCLFLPGRNNDVVASIAESLWVIAGRDDVDWLKAYVPRAPDYSDDGLTWRAAYGPRLRNWEGTDQLAAVLDLLRQDATTRRAVMSLYDPSRDFVESKDIPCNNWLHWLIRDGALHLTVGIRSNDVVWGFSGVNSFEWSLLQDMMAFWAGIRVGDATYLASSFHLYERHYGRARTVVDRFAGVTCYDFGVGSPPFQTPFERLDDVLVTWFDLEGHVRRDPNTPADPENRIEDPFLSVALQMVRLYRGEAAGWASSRLAEELAGLPECDLTAAMYEYLGRRHPEVLKDVPHPNIAQFLAAYSHGAGAAAPSTRAIIQAIKHLHAEKDAAYGPAWKKRGELRSVLPNIARKVDRLAQYVQSGAVLRDESILDTAVDLLVYVVKYHLLLLEQAGEAAVAATLPGWQPPLSDDRAAFDTLLGAFGQQTEVGRPTSEVIPKVVARFEELYDAAEAGAPIEEERLIYAQRFAALSFELLKAVSAERPHLSRELVREYGRLRGGSTTGESDE